MELDSEICLISNLHKKEKEVSTFTIDERVEPTSISGYGFVLSLYTATCFKFIS
jgi:hypothetical protein